MPEKMTKKTIYKVRARLMAAERYQQVRKKDDKAYKSAGNIINDEFQNQNIK